MNYRHKFNIGDIIHVYRDFEGYCGVGVIKQIHHTSVETSYTIHLQTGSYLGNNTPLICYVDECKLKEFKEVK